MKRLYRIFALGFAMATLPSCDEKAAPEVAKAGPALASKPESPPAAEPSGWKRTATVDMQQLFKEYHRTNEAQKEINVERARIQEDNNDRLALIRELDTELQDMRKQLADPSISESRRQSTFNEFNTKQQEGIALDRERREFLQRRNQSLNEKMVQRMKGVLDEIRKLVEEKAKADDYDYVFDKSGMSTSQVPFFLHTPQAEDITAKLLAELNAEAPPVSETDAGEPAADGVEKKN